MEKSRQTLGKTKKIKDATLIGKKTSIDKQHLHYPEEIEVTDHEVIEGEPNTPPLEMTDELRDELLEEEKKKEEKQKELRSNTQHYTNGVNEWQLIAKTYNNLLDWEHVTTAMKCGNGLLVCVKEAIGQRMTSTVTYVPNVNMYKDEKGFWQIYDDNYGN